MPNRQKTSVIFQSSPVLVSVEVRRVRDIVARLLDPVDEVPIPVPSRKGVDKFPRTRAGAVRTIEGDFHCRLGAGRLDWCTPAAGIIKAFAGRLVVRVVVVSLVGCDA